MAPVRLTDLDRVPRTSYPGRDRVASLVAPVFGPVVTRWASNSVQRLMGFWVLWHSFGGQKALVDSGFMPERTMQRNRAEFRRVFKVDVADFGPDAAAAVHAWLGAPRPAAEPDAQTQPSPEHAAS